MITMVGVLVLVLGVFYPFLMLLAVTRKLGFVQKVINEAVVEINWDSRFSGQKIYNLFFMVTPIAYCGGILFSQL